ncbi:hypothetical protein ACIOHC_36330 [Streptomyces sp. NPDC088252]|uniref:hypothetical protein n=1 Tax=Streptomyces sp. NPDC088252 TaxID=3365845 RepID=UPI00380446B5
MDIKYLNLWSYEVDYHGTDCDGSHYDRREFMAVERPTEVVYSYAELTGDYGPSVVTLVDGSDDDGGTAHVGTPTEEGSRAHDISWQRVTSSEKLADFLDTYEKEGPRIRTGFYYTDLYRARIRLAVKVKFPEATLVTFRPSARRGEPWIVLEVRGLDERNCPATFWRGAGSPFEESVLKQMSHDLEQLYADLPDGDTKPVSLHV